MFSSMASRAPRGSLWRTTANRGATTFSTSRSQTATTLGAISVVPAPAAAMSNCTNARPGGVGNRLDNRTVTRAACRAGLSAFLSPLAAALLPAAIELFIRILPGNACLDASDFSNGVAYTPHHRLYLHMRRKNQSQAA